MPTSALTYSILAHHALSLSPTGSPTQAACCTHTYTPGPGFDDLVPWDPSIASIPWILSRRPGPAWR